MPEEYTIRVNEPEAEAFVTGFLVGLEPNPNTSQHQELYWYSDKREEFAAKLSDNKSIPILDPTKSLTPLLKEVQSTNPAPAPAPPVPSTDVTNPLPVETP